MYFVSSDDCECMFKLYTILSMCFFLSDDCECLFKLYIFLDMCFVLEKSEATEEMRSTQSQKQRFSCDVQEVVMVKLWNRRNGGEFQQI